LIPQNTRALYWFGLVAEAIVAQPRFKDASEE